MANNQQPKIRAHGDRRSEPDVRRLARGDRPPRRQVDTEQAQQLADALEHEEVARRKTVSRNRSANVTPSSRRRCGSLPPDVSPPGHRRRRRRHPHPPSPQRAAALSLAPAPAIHARTAHHRRAFRGGSSSTVGRARRLQSATERKPAGAPLGRNRPTAAGDRRAMAAESVTTNGCSMRQGGSSRRPDTRRVGEFRRR